MQGFFGRWTKFQPEALVSVLLHRNLDHKRWNVPTFGTRRPARSLVPFWRGDPRDFREEGMDLRDRFEGCLDDPWQIFLG